MIPTRKGVMVLLLVAVVVLAWPAVWVVVPAALWLGATIGDPQPWRGPGRRS